VVGGVVKAVVRHGVGDIKVDEVPDPKIREPSDHEAVGVIEEVGPAVRGLSG
jgi:hypothetical protein